MGFRGFRWWREELGRTVESKRGPIEKCVMKDNYIWALGMGVGVSNRVSRELDPGSGVSLTAV